MCPSKRTPDTSVDSGGSWTLLPKVANFAEGEHKRKIKAKCARLPDV